MEVTRLTELEEQIKCVAHVREEKAALEEQKKERYQEWLDHNQSLIDDIYYKTELLNQAETTLRNLTIEAYKATGNKQPVPGVGIRILTKLEYDPKDALEYAKEHGVALKLDTAAFEKMAKIAELRPAFVTTSEEIQATIATKLEVK